MSSGGDDQSEDGELRHSPGDVKGKEDVMDFSLSDEDADTADSLDIKPPQANRVSHSHTASHSKRRERTREGRVHRSRSERHRDQERSHGHREKRHRERDLKKYKREGYHDKEHFHKSEMFREVRYSDQSGKYSESQLYRREENKYTHEGTSREIRMTTYESRSEKRNLKEERYVAQEGDKPHRHEERKIKSIVDQTLDDLRERLLDKRRIKEGSEEYKHYEKESRRKKEREVEEIEDADLYVKEIIDLSTVEDGRDRREKYHRREEKQPEKPEEKEWGKEEDEKAERKMMTAAEREEQEQRKERLLEAEREIARQKEQYLLDRERRHKQRQERQEAKRKLIEEQQQHQLNKRQRMSGELGQYKDKDLSIVTVSDNSSESSSEEEEEENVRSDDSDNDRSEESESSVHESEKSEKDSEEEDNYKEQSPMSVGGLAKSDCSTSQSHSRSPSPIANGDNQPSVNPVIKKKSPTPPKKIINSDLPPYFPAIQGCRSVEEFQCLNRIEEGTYGVVYRARDKRTDEIVALKRLKMEKEKEGFPITSLREINTLLKGQHPNIVTVREIVVGSNMDKIFIVMDYVEHDLKSLMETMRHKKQVFVPGEVKCLLKQLLGAVAHLHDNWILHRDLKTSNLLLSHKGILKVGDFGLAREYGSPLKAYTPVVVTLWYRAPELLLCCKEYSTPIDMWSVGCIFAELLLMNALFPGKSEVDQLNRVFKDLGTPNEKIWPGYNELPAVKKMKFTEYPVSQLRNRFSMLTETGQNLLQRFLTYDPAQRVTAEDALTHPYFTEAPLPIDPAMFPTWPAKSELGHRKALAASPKPPSGGREYKQLGDGDEDSALGFHMGTATGASLMESRRLAMGGGFSLKF